MKPRHVLLASALLVLILAGSVQAFPITTVTFTARDGSYASYTESGMTFTPLAPSTTFDIAGNHWDSTIFDDSDDDWSATLGGPTFQLVSFDRLHIDSVDPLRFEAFRFGVSVGVETVTGFGPYTFGTLGGLLYDKVEMRTFGSTWDDAELDNLAFRTIPEPSTLVLLGVGALGLGLGVRRRRK